MFNQENLEKFKHKRVFGTIAFLVAVFLAVTTVSSFVGILNKVKEGKYIGQEIESKNTITVSDSAEIYAKPDLGLINVSVITEAKTVLEAMDQNTEKANKVIQYLKNSGISENDLKTTDFNIYPRYSYLETVGYSYGQRVLAGYEVRQTIQVKIRELSKVGELIQGTTNAGANEVGNLQFTIDDEDELRSQAREEAIKKAKAKAEKLADQLGVDLVRITSFNEGGISPSYRQLDYAFAETLSASSMPEIETGQNKIEVTVSVTYEIN